MCVEYRYEYPDCPRRQSNPSGAVCISSSWFNSPQYLGFWVRDCKRSRDQCPAYHNPGYRGIIPQVVPHIVRGSACVKHTIEIEGPLLVGRPSQRTPTGQIIGQQPFSNRGSGVQSSTVRMSNEGGNYGPTLSHLMAEHEALNQYGNQHGPRVKQEEVENVMNRATPFSRHSMSSSARHPTQPASAAYHQNMNQFRQTLPSSFPQQMQPPRLSYESMGRFSQRSGQDSLFELQRQQSLRLGHPLQQGQEMISPRQQQQPRQRELQGFLQHQMGSPGLSEAEQYSQGTVEDNDARSSSDGDNSQFMSANKQIGDTYNEDMQDEI